LAFLAIMPRGPEVACRRFPLFRLAAPGTVRYSPQMTSRWFQVGALLLAVVVTAGAFGAHVLRQRLDASSLQLWETAAHYLALGGLGLLAVGLAWHMSPGRGWTIAGGLLTVGAVVFGGTVGALALGGPRWLGAVTPVGGLSLILGFVAMMVAAGRR
jgi:uncharacterized membrane protein YgdD (TMEM256/DUF423 family)